MDALAIVYARRDVVFVVSSDRTASGFWTTGSFLLRSGVGEFDLQDAIVRCISASSVGVDDPSRELNPINPVIKLAGIRSWSEFVRGTKCVLVARVGNVFRVTPTENGGAKRGFVHLDALAEEVSVQSQLAEAVIRALNRSL